MPHDLPPELMAMISSRDMLPTPLPTEPMGMFKAWFDDQAAQRRTPNPNAMCLATIGLSGLPRGRVVLCKAIDTELGYLVFFTNYEGDKAKELAANPRAGATFHWDESEVQVRFEGMVVRSPEAESEEYFASRPWQSRLSPWASRQSQPLYSRGQLLGQYAEVIQRLGLSPAELLANGDKVHIPRPPHWGGFRLWAQRVELWLGGGGRMHDRAVWERELHPKGAGFGTSPWKSMRLQP